MISSKMSKKKRDSKETQLLKTVNGNKTTQLATNYYVNCQLPDE